VGRGALAGQALARDAQDVLREVFGHAEFRGEQEEVVRHIIAGGDAVVLFPTGAGKSICYQVPALCRPGVAIVISPSEFFASSSYSGPALITYVSPSSLIA